MHKYFTQPIPDLTEARLRRTGSRAHPIDLASAHNKEGAVDVRVHGIRGDNYYHRKDNPPYWHAAPGAIPELYVREGILSRLLLVNESLKSEGYELFCLTPIDRLRCKIISTTSGFRVFTRKIS